MCLGVPGMITALEGDTARVRYGALEGTICVALVPDVQVGDYVIVHVGFAIEKLDGKATEEMLRLLAEVVGNDDAA